MKRDRKNSGFTLIELMIVVVIIGILAALAIPRFMRVATKAKQSEAKQLLKQIYTMQHTYFVQHDSYCLNGVQASATQTLAYAIINVEIMLPARYTYMMTVPNPTTFTCTATGNLDDDVTIDTWSIDQGGTLLNTIDDSVN